MSKLQDYSALFNYSPLSMWVYDLETFEILDVNNAAIDLYGYSKEEFISFTIKELRPEEEIPNVLAAHSNIKESKGNIYFGVYTHQKKNGERMRMEINGHQVDFQGRECIMVTCQNVTLREKQLLNLEESARKLQAASDIAKLGYWRLELDANTLIWSDKIYEIWGRNKDEFELNSQNFHQTIHPSDRAFFDQEQEAAYSGKKELNFSHRIILPNGEVKWVHELGRLNRNQAGVPISFEGTVQDITSKKNEEQHLRLLESVITHTNDAVLITEAEPFDEPGQRIIYVNEAFTKMTGYESHEVIGKSPRLLQGPRSDRNELSRLGKAMRRWEPCEITTVNYKKNGEEFWINFSVSPVADEKGWFTHWIAIERDVTEQKNKELEKELISQISLNFNIESDFIESVKKLCHTIGVFGAFDLVELWTPNIENSLIHLLAFDAGDLKGVKLQELGDQAKIFHESKSLPAMVWEKGTPLLLEQKEENRDFKRIEAAGITGIKSLLGFPILYNKQVVGVLLMGTQNKGHYLNKYIQIFERIKGFIGTEINRKKLENDLNHLYEAIPDVICLVDFKGRILKINKAGYQLLGYPEEEILYHNFDEFIHPEDKHISARKLEKLQVGESCFHFENRNITKTGDVVWLSWKCNSEVREGLIYASAKDITNEKKLSILNSQASFLAKVGSWEIDLVRQKIFWTDIVHGIHETDPNVFTPDFDAGINFYREDFRDMARNSVADSIKNGSSFNFEAVVVTANNNERWVKAIGNAEFLEGKCIRIYGSLQDIHDRKEVENRLLSLSDNLPGLMFQYLVDPDGTDTLKYVSKGAKELWGYSPEESMANIQLIWDRIKEGGDYDEVQASITYSIQNKSKWSSKWRYVMPNGEIRNHSGSGSPEYLIDGSVIFNSLILDITEEKKTEQLLSQASSMAKIGSWELDMTDEKGDAMYWSPMTRKILEVDAGYSPTLTGGFEFYTEESKTRIQKAMDLLLVDGLEFDEELLIKTDKSKLKWIRCIGRSERIGGKSHKIFGSFQDIHDTKSLQLQIEEILGSISDAFYAVDRNWDFTYFNKEAEQLLNKKSDEVLGKNIWEIFSPVRGTVLEEVYKRVAVADEPESFEYFYPGNGSWYELNVYPSHGGISSYFKNIDERIKAKEAIQKAYDEKNRILESIGDAFFTMNRDFTVTYWNNTAEKLIGVKREDLVGNNLWEVFPDAVDLPSFTNYHKVLKSGEPVTFEDYYGLWLEVSAYPSEEGISVFFRDITLKKEADERLLRALEEKNRILESIGDAFFALDQDWVVTYWNKRAEEIIGLKREELVGYNLWEKFPMAKDMKFFNQYRKSFEEQVPVSFQEYFPPLDQWYEANSYPTPEGLSVFFRDITIQKKAERKILEANERFEKVAQATTDAIWDWDLLSDNFTRNNGFEKLFGYKVSKNLTSSDFWEDSFFPEDIPGIQESLKSCLKDPEAEFWQHQYRIIHSEGEIKTVIDKGVIIRNEVGEVVRMVGAITDITDRIKHEEELNKLNQILKGHIKELQTTNEQLEQFAFIASHDLQEPLRMISSFLTQLERKYKDQLDSKAHQYIYFATDGAKRMKQIILDLLDYSKAGKTQDFLESIDLGELVDGYKLLRRKVIKEKSAVIRMEDLPVLDCFKAALIQTLHCLLDNAIKYSRHDLPPKITIAAYQQGDYHIIRIEDNGIGIDPQFFDKIFIIFQRLHKRDQFDGTGIGLSIAKKHVEAWGGEIWLESQVGQGSVFYFSIPKVINLDNSISDYPQ
ncbi:PAS domain S-box protein [Algoriphagus persicinus]|uniref:PAS domain S-box protein n=1 Tax=Algoriphagus persicinus TaxID=3108754 RepID=UPI002B3EBC13|nr:PAS domain S-box protein [Algoriphagus sp. E1-3-M2]MEB2784117.1 PAS domain S-box protein [Algoriphagus sp. E1-3-M2]